MDPDGNNVSFDEFIAFMAEENAGAENAGQLLDAFKVLANGTCVLFVSILLWGLLVHGLIMA